MRSRCLLGKPVGRSKDVVWAAAVRAGSMPAVLGCGPHAGRPPAGAARAGCGCRSQPGAAGARCRCRASRRACPRTMSSRPRRRRPTSRALTACATARATRRAPASAAPRRALLTAQCLPSRKPVAVDKAGCVSRVRPGAGGCCAPRARERAGARSTAQDCAERLASAQDDRERPAVCTACVPAERQIRGRPTVRGGAQAGDLRAMYNGTRDAGLGAEVKRRVLMGTYALSAGYYDAYYKRAQQARAPARRARRRRPRHPAPAVRPCAPRPACALTGRLPQQARAAGARPTVIPTLPVSHCQNPQCSHSLLRGFGQASRLPSTSQHFPAAGPCAYGWEACWEPLGSGLTLMGSAGITLGAHFPWEAWELYLVLLGSAWVVENYTSYFWEVQGLPWTGVGSSGVLACRMLLA